MFKVNEADFTPVQIHGLRIKVSPEQWAYHTALRLTSSVWNTHSRVSPRVCADAECETSLHYNQLEINHFWGMGSCGIIHVTTEVCICANSITTRRSLTMWRQIMAETSLMVCPVERRNRQARWPRVQQKYTMMMMFLKSLITFMSVLVREREREIPFLRWQQLLIKSGPMKQDSRQEPISLWIMPYLSFSCFSLHSTFTLDSLHLSRQILEVRGREKIDPLAHIGLPSGSVQIIFFRVGNYRARDTELRRLPGLFQVWSEEKLINQKGFCWFSSSADWKHSAADFQKKWIFSQLQHLLSWSPIK